MTGLPNESLAVALRLNVILTPRFKKLPFLLRNLIRAYPPHLRRFKFSVDGDFHLSLAHALVEFTEITVDLTCVVASPLFDIIIERSQVFSLIHHRSRNLQISILKEMPNGCSRMFKRAISMLDLLPCFPCDLRDPSSSKRSDQVVHKRYRLACCVYCTGGVYRTKRRLIYDTRRSKIIFKLTNVTLKLQA